MTREEAIKILRDTPIDIRSTREDDIHTLYATAQEMAIEALQAEPIVRCKDCKNAWRKMGTHYHCEQQMSWHEEEYFCSFGERREP